MLTDETVLTRLGYYCISWPGERVFYVDSTFPVQHCCRKACLAFSTLCFVPVRVFIVWRRQEDAVGSKIKVGRDTSSETSVAAGSTNWASSLPTNTGARKTTCAKVHLKLLFYVHYSIRLHLKLHCWDLRLQHRVSATRRLSVSFYCVVT